MNWTYTVCEPNELQKRYMESGRPVPWWGIQVAEVEEGHRKERFKAILADAITDHLRDPLSQIYWEGGYK